MDTMMMSKMMGTMPTSTMGIDMASMQECIEACDAVAMAATMCADVDTAAGMGRCASMCTNMADVATTMMRMMMRPMAHDATAMRAMLDASAAMCQACMDECSQHADTMECCRICAMACQNMKDACGALMAKMA